MAAHQQERACGARHGPARGCPGTGVRAASSGSQPDSPAAEQQCSAWLGRSGGATASRDGGARAYGFVWHRTTCGRACELAACTVRCGSWSLPQPTPAASLRKALLCCRDRTHATFHICNMTRSAWPFAVDCAKLNPVIKQQRSRGCFLLQLASSQRSAAGATVTPHVKSWLSISIHAFGLLAKLSTVSWQAESPAQAQPHSQQRSALACIGTCSGT
jgi:hypothetical protein